jgi:predicted transcriptional regulator
MPSAPMRGYWFSETVLVTANHKNGKEIISLSNQRAAKLQKYQNGIFTHLSMISKAIIKIAVSGI